MVRHGQGTQRPAKRKRAHVTHEYLGGIGVVPEKTEARPRHGTAKHGEFARPRHIGNLQIIGYLDVAGKVGKEQIGQETDDGGTGGQAVQAVCQVDGIRSTDDDKGRKDDIPPPQVRQDRLEEGDRDARTESRLYIKEDAHKKGDCDLTRQPYLPGIPLLFFLTSLL